MEGGEGGLFFHLIIELLNLYATIEVVLAMLFQVFQLFIYSYLLKTNGFICVSLSIKNMNF